ncbi:hypothetical protein HMPREF3201_02186 [Megasphaera sp. MJR8396C]|nr:hypothetical protein HMPREF3201_02186 [Megasphaera sp. MJR8396C]
MLFLFSFFLKKTRQKNIYGVTVPIEGLHPFFFLLFGMIISYK